MKPSNRVRMISAFWRGLCAVAGLTILATSAIAQVGDDNPTGTSGQFNGTSSTAGSYDPYTSNATRSITDIAVAGAVGGYPLAFTRTMNSRYPAGGNPLEFGPAGSWRHNFQWSIFPLTMTSNLPNKWSVMPTVYSVDYPDGRRVSFNSSSQDTKFRAFTSGISDRFQQLTNPQATDDDCYLLLPDGGKVHFVATIERVGGDQGPVTSTFTYTFVGIIDPHGLETTVSKPADGSMTIQEPAGRQLKLFYTWYNGGTVLDRIEERAYEGAPTRRSVKYNYTVYTTPNGTRYTALDNVVYFGDANYTALYRYQNNNIDSNGRPLIAKCVDPMYPGPMWRIAYTFAPNASGVVSGQLQSENYLDPALNVGAAVSTLTVNRGTPNTRTETRGDGATRTFNYSGGKLANSSDWKGQYSYVSYDAYGYVGATTDANNQTTTISREGTIGAISVLTHPDQTTKGYAYLYRDNAPYFAQIVGNERGKNTYYTRDPNTGRVAQIDYPDYPDGAYETYTYNQFGQVLVHTRTKSKQPLDLETESFTYDGRGLKQTFTNAETHVTRYYYDGNDRLWQVVDPLTHSTWFSYNARGQVTEVRNDDQTTKLSGYNADGTLAWTADENHPGAATDLNQRTRYQYDDYKRVTSVTDPVGETTSYNYAQDWVNPYVHTTSSVKGMFFPSGKQIHYAYDENFRRFIQREAPGVPGDDAWTWYGYDPVGNLASVQDPKGNVTTYGYDTRNRRSSMTAPAPFNNQITRWEYDGVGNMIKETRPDTFFRRWEYDSMNRVQQTYGFGNEGTYYGRDLAGNVTEIVDANGASYGFEYDKLNRKKRATYPADANGVGRDETWAFDDAGNMDQYKNPNGNSKTITYDNRNRPDLASWNDGATPSVNTHFDAAGRLTGVSTSEIGQWLYTGGGWRYVVETPATSVTFGYDDANRQIWEDQTLAGHPTHRVATSRDADGLRSGLSVPGTYDIYYEYTQRGQLAHIRDGNHNPFYDFSYDLSGNLTRRQGNWDYVNATNFAYDEMNRVTTAEQTGSADRWFARSYYQYDNLNRVTATWRDEQSQQGERFAYDAIGQLSSVAYNAGQPWTTTPQNPNRSVNYHNDALNRTSVDENGTAYSVSPLNQYTSITGQDLRYDGNFNIAYLNGGYAYYDAEKRLTSVVAGPPLLQNVYDGLGRCVKRVYNNETRLFTYDRWKQLIEWNESDQFLAWNTYGAGSDEILCRWDNAAGRHIKYKLDRLGNVVALLDAWGNVLEKYTYDVFGDPTVTNADGSGARNSSNYGNRFMFTGREYFPSLALYDYRNRYYRPSLGRFLQADPLGFGGGDANLFRYCGGDPVNHVDPSGLTFWGSILSSINGMFSGNGTVATTEPVTVTGTPVHETAETAGMGPRGDASPLDYSGGLSGEGNHGDGGGSGSGGGGGTLYAQNRTVPVRPPPIRGPIPDKDRPFQDGPERSDGEEITGENAAEALRQYGLFFSGLWDFLSELLPNGINVQPPLPLNPGSNIPSSGAASPSPNPTGPPAPRPPGA